MPEEELSAQRIQDERHGSDADIRHEDRKT